jgi:opacity protein-like surface antigen
MKRLLSTAAVVAILGMSGAAFAQYQAYQPAPPQQGYGSYQQAYPQPGMPPQGYNAAYQQVPAGYPGSGMAVEQRYRGTAEPQYGTSSHQYPPGPGGQWQQSYQLGARPEMSGSVTPPPDVATSQGTTMANPAYMPSAARLGTDGGVTVPAYGSTYQPYGYSR